MPITKATAFSLNSNLLIVTIFFFLAKFPLKDNKYAKSPKKLQMVFHWCPISQYCFAGVHKMFVFVLILKFVSLVEKVKSE